MGQANIHTQTKEEQVSKYTKKRNPVAPPVKLRTYKNFTKNNLRKGFVSSDEVRGTKLILRLHTYSIWKI